MVTKFNVRHTTTLSKEIEDFTKSNKSLKNKLLRIVSKLEENPFQGERIEASSLGERRIWVGNDYRLFYDIRGGDVWLVHLRKKDKSTYR